MSEIIIKSKERVSERGEVFTPRLIVDRMLDLLPDDVWAPEKLFLEPACGNGNFLVAILERKLAHICKSDLADVEARVLRVVSSLYGIDIAQDNIDECHERLKKTVAEFWQITPAGAELLDNFLHANVIVGNTLQPDSVLFAFWVWTGSTFTLSHFATLQEMMDGVIAKKAAASSSVTNLR